MKEFLIEVFSFEGRWNRQKFLLYPLGVFVIIIILLSLFYTGDEESTSIGVLIIQIMLISILTYVIIAAFAKRLRDLDKDPLLSLLILIPFINILLFIFCAFFPGTEGPNQYGTDPLHPDYVLNED